MLKETTQSKLITQQETRAHEEFILLMRRYDRKSHALKKTSQSDKAQNTGAPVKAEIAHQQRTTKVETAH